MASPCLFPHLSIHPRTFQSETIPHLNQAISEWNGVLPMSMSGQQAHTRTGPRGHSRDKDINSTHLTDKRGKTHSTHYSMLAMIFFSFFLPFISKYLVSGKLPGAKKENVSQIEPPCPQQVSPLVPLCVCYSPGTFLTHTQTWHITELNMNPQWAL